MEREFSSFYQLAPGIGTGAAPTPAWQRLAEYPLVIFVGVTGVGKSTTLDALADLLPFQLLPNRRILTDNLIIAYLQRQDGQSAHPVTDRTARFAFTRRYRAQFSGGMSHALSQLLIDQDPGQESCSQESPNQKRWLIFDGLRGVNEVDAAAAALPQARFVVLAAPDIIRVQRLLGRGDSFDQITLVATNNTENRNPKLANPEVQPKVQKVAQRFTDIGLPEADVLFSPAEVATLLGLCTAPLGQGTVPVKELQAKLKIVTEERQNYDPTAALNTLQEVAAERTLVIDTTVVSAVQAAQQIATWVVM